MTDALAQAEAIARTRFEHWAKRLKALSDVGCDITIEAAKANEAAEIGALIAALRERIPAARDESKDDGVKQ